MATAFEHRRNPDRRHTLRHLWYFLPHPLYKYGSPRPSFDRLAMAGTFDSLEFLRIAAPLRAAKQVLLGCSPE